MDIVEWIPLFTRTASDIRASMDADANAGLVSTDSEWVDTREGTFYFDVTQVCLLECARIWDSLATEVPAAAFPLFAWGDYLDYHAATFGLERKAAVAAQGTVTFTGTAGTAIPTGVTVGTIPASADVDPVEFLTTAPATVGVGGTISVPVVAADEGASGNVSAGAIIEIVSPSPGVSAVTNAAATTGGVDVENDEDLRGRILLEFEGAGGGRISDYKRWALSVPGVGRVFVNPVWNGPGTVQVVVMTSTGDPVAGSVVSAVQDYIDPATGSAEGQAPPGVTVTVQTPTAVAVNIVASVTFKSGAYTLGGTGGTIEQQSQIVAALSDYIDNLDVGEDVIYNHVLAAFFRAEGVLNVSGLTVNGGTADVGITPGTPTQIASLGTVTLS